MTGADWAIAHGDVEALAHVTRELSRKVPRQLRGRLAEITELCDDDPDRACAEWSAVREEIVERS